VAEQELFHPEDFGVADYAAVEARRQERWNAQTQRFRGAPVAPPNCPGCGSLMQYNLAMHQWECNGLQPAWILTDEDFTMGRRGRTANEHPLGTNVLEGRIQLSVAAFRAALPDLLSPPSAWPSSAPTSQPTSPTWVRETTNRDATKKWFDDMPKSLKLLYIKEDNESKTMMEHYEVQDVKHITFRNMSESCQRMLIQTYMKLQEKT